MEYIERESMFNEDTIEIINNVLGFDETKVINGVFHINKNKGICKKKELDSYYKDVCFLLFATDLDEEHFEIELNSGGVYEFEKFHHIKCEYDESIVHNRVYSDIEENYKGINPCPICNQKIFGSFFNNNVIFMCSKCSFIYSMLVKKGDFESCKKVFNNLIMKDNFFK